MNGLPVWTRDTTRLAFYNKSGWTITDAKWKAEVLTGEQINWISYENSLNVGDFKNSQWKNYLDGSTVTAQTLDPNSLCGKQCIECGEYTRGQSNNSICHHDSCMSNEIETPNGTCFKCPTGLGPA